jgi:hypothetical protein
MDAQFPVTDILESNDLDDTLWALRCLPEHNNLWRKYAVWCARQVEHLMTDNRSVAAIDVAWRHSEGLATDGELAAAWAAMWAAQAAAGAASRDVRYAAHVAALAARDAALAALADWALDWDAARQKQQHRLVVILTAGEWVEVGNE